MLGFWRKVPESDAQILEEGAGKRLGLWDPGWRSSSTLCLLASKVGLRTLSVCNFALPQSTDNSEKAKTIATVQ